MGQAAEVASADDNQLSICSWFARPVDSERYPELAVRFNVRGIPNFAVFAHGRLASQQAVTWPDGLS